MKKLLKAVSKINRKSLKHAKRDQILLDQFEGVEGPIDTKHMLISLMLPQRLKCLFKRWSAKLRFFVELGMSTGKLFTGVGNKRDQLFSGISM